MIFSMTGYGKAVVSANGITIHAELRALNSKQVDLSARLPMAYRALEVDIRKRLTDTLHRGKIELTIVRELPEGQGEHKLNKNLIQAYVRQLSEVGSTIGLESNQDYLSIAMRLPDVVAQSEDNISEEEQHLLMAAIDASAEKLVAFRAKEGKDLEPSLLQYVQDIEAKLESIVPFEKERVERVRQKLMEALEKNQLTEHTDNSRLEQEMIFYLEKLDISEEKQRLAAHCAHFRQTVHTKDLSKGKKLGFITQEMGREINTLGSKSQHADMQRIVVGMKDNLEKIKEQVLNLL